jgi:hypothetical protein
LLISLIMTMSVTSILSALLLLVPMMSTGGRDLNQMRHSRRPLPMTMTLMKMIGRYFQYFLPFALATGSSFGQDTNLQGYCTKVPS